MQKAPRTVLKPVAGCPLTITWPTATNEEHESVISQMKLLVYSTCSILSSITVDKGMKDHFRVGSAQAIRATQKTLVSGLFQAEPAPQPVVVVCLGAPMVLVEPIALACVRGSTPLVALSKQRLLALRAIFGVKSFTAAVFDLSHCPALAEIVKSMDTTVKAPWLTGTFMTFNATITKCVQGAKAEKRAKRIVQKATAQKPKKAKKTKKRRIL